MIADAVVDDADPCRKVGRTGITVRIEEKQRFVDARQPAACQCPVYDVIVLLRGRHVVDILRVISAADGLLHAYKLPGVAVDHNIVISSISRNKNGTFFVGQAKGGGK